MTSGEKGDVKAFWNSRAGLGQWAGTRDVNLKQLEMQAIASYVRDGMRVLDVGCGNGIMAIELARRYAARVTGIDFAEEMVAAARTLADGVDLKGTLEFRVGDVRTLAETERFNLVYTERTLINLPDWPAQRDAIAGIGRLLAAGGAYVMCEHSQDGLNGMNEFRARVGLPEMKPPWHNRYLRDAEIEGAAFPGMKLETVSHFSATYYFVSRVVNAWLAAQEGKEPDYDAPVNQLGLKLPPLGNFGQGRIWVWRKTG